FGIGEPGTPVDAEISPYWGLAAGRNVITIQVEALQNFVLGAYYNGQELTPNLNKMLLNDTIYFDHYYYQIGGGNTADAEFAVNNSLYAPETEAAYSAYPFNDYYSMATLLKDNGYKSATAFHGFKADFWSRNIAYPGQGYDAYLSGDDYFANPTETTGLGITDGEFFRKSVEYMKTQKTPFYAFLITLSSHYSFDMKPQFISLEVAPEDEGTLFANYMRSIHYVDQAFGMLLDELKAAGLYANSVLTIYGDHFALPVYNADCKRLVTALTGRNYTYAQHFNVPLIIHIPGSGVTETCSNIGGHIDVMPTLLHLLGLENRKGVMLGYNILTTTDGAVFEQTHLARGSFFWGNTMYMFPFSGIAMNAEAYALDTGEKLNAGDFVAKADEGRRAYELGMYILENDLSLKERFEAVQNK
ncbi:MAG: LTA synthase family protein, partial [Clostridia bacterium]|nr:LTA synthase family protein [Clostridia bacterium]